MKVILVFFDTLRYDHASFNGYHVKTTPVLDQLAQEAAVFTNCYASDVPTQPCYTSTFAGLRGIKTGVVSHGQPEETISTFHASFPWVLASNGILTAAVSTLCRFRRWFAQGFVHYVQPDMKTWLQHVSCEMVNEAALPWLETHAGQKDFFLFLQYWDPHTPYNLVPKMYLGKFYSGNPYDPANKSLADLRSRPMLDYFLSGGAVPELKEGLTDVEFPVAQYDAEINYADEHFARVLELLERKKVLQDTMIIFTSDHGEAMRGEHGIYFDHMDAYEQVSHVPLFVWSPGRVKAGKINSFVQHIDLAPTILDTFAAETPDPLLMAEEARRAGNTSERPQTSNTPDGKSLWPLLTGNGTRHRDFAVTNQGLWSAQRAYRTEDWTLMRTYAPGMLTDVPEWQLFNRRRDPAEMTDISAKETAAFAEMKTTYLEWLDRELGGAPDPLAEEAVRSSAANSAKALYQRWVETQRGAAQSMTPKVRAEIDDVPDQGKRAKTSE